MAKSRSDLSDRVALVTGGGGGIGRGIALSLAELGADIAVLDIVPERCDEVVARVTALGRKALPITADVMDSSQLSSAVSRAAEFFGRLDILVNNAGGVRSTTFLELTERNWRRHIDLNLISVLAATSAAVPIMIDKGCGGSIINVTSIEGSRACPGSSVYAACKAGVNNLTRTLALELADHGIRINAIAPDYIETPGLRGNLKGPVDETSWIRPSPGHVESVRRRTPAGRVGTAEECGAVAAFLASDLSSYVTGTVIPVDGGTWASSGWVRARSGNWILPPEPED